MNSTAYPDSIASSLRDASGGNRSEADVRYEDREVLTKEGASLFRDQGVLLRGTRLTDTAARERIEGATHQACSVKRIQPWSVPQLYCIAPERHFQAACEITAGKLSSPKHTSTATESAFPKKALRSEDSPPRSSLWILLP